MGLRAVLQVALPMAGCAKRLTKLIRSGAEIGAR
jgi:hypothetical protein